MATPSPASSLPFHSSSHLNPPAPSCSRSACAKAEGYPRRLPPPVLIDLTADTPSPPVAAPEPLHHYPQLPHIHTQPHLHHQGSAFHRVPGPSNVSLPAFQSNGPSSSHSSCPYLRWQHSREHPQRVNTFPNSAFGPPLTHQPQPFYHSAPPTSGPVLIDLEHCDNTVPETSMASRPVLVSSIPVVTPTYVPATQPHSHQHQLQHQHQHHPPVVPHHPPAQPMEHSHAQNHSHGESLSPEESQHHYHYHHHHHHHHYSPFQYQLSQPQIQPVTHLNYPPPLQHHIHHHQIPLPTFIPRPGNAPLFPHAFQASPDMLLHLLSSMVTMPQPPPPPTYPGWEEGTNQEQYETLLNIAEQIGEAKPRGLTKRDIERLLTYRVKDDGEKNENDGRCVICLMEFEENDQLRVLPCLHEYHVKCIDKWLRSNRTCPICRSRVTVPQNA